MTTPDPTPTPTPDPEPAKPAEAPAKAETDWKAEARKHEARAKENATKAKQYDDFVESQKTETQKLADRAASAEKERDEARLEALRVKVGAAKNLPSEFVDLLKGSTEEELAAHADTLAKHFKANVRPSGPVDQGVRGGPAGATPRDQFADFLNKQLGQPASSP